MMRQTPTLYDILGVNSDASEEEIRAAFRKLTLKNHPDRHVGEERRRAEERFQEITEAFNVLSRPEPKQRYDREIAQGLPQAKAMDPREVARRLAGKGAQAYRDGKLAEAVEHLQMAINHDEKCGRAHYFLAVTYARLPGRERDAMRHIERAGQLEPNNPAIRTEEAQMFLAAGMAGRARRAAEQALQYDPTNAKASEILRKIDTPDRPQGDGLLGRLRRKG
jgi:curved DNA-binding protein CbpA